MTNINALSPPRWEVVLAILFGPVAVYYGIAWILGKIVHLTYSQSLDAYPWVLIGMYLFLGIVVYRESIADGLGLPRFFDNNRRKVLGAIGLGVLLVFGILLIENYYEVIWSVFAPIPTATYSKSPFTIDVMIVALPIGAGIVEELVWRGYGISRLQALTGSQWKSILISSIGFGIWHVDLFHFGYAFLDGLLFGYVYSRYKSLLPVVIGHWLFDFIAALATFG